ncbi:MAG: hypothetical protein ACTSRG_08870 [Candidatus Helarchaeota archaeon]
MVEKSNMTQILMKAFYLNKSQAELYSLLLIRGILTLGEISLSLKKNQDECNKIIRDLINLRLISSVSGKVIRYKAMPPFKGFFALINEFQALFDKVNQDISTKSKELIEGFKEDIQKQINSFQDLFQDQREKAIILEDQKNHYKQDIDAYITEIKDNSTNIANELNEIFTLYLNSFEERINIIKMDVDKSFSETLAEIRGKKIKNKDFLEENLTNWISPQKDNMKKLLNFLFTNLNSSFETVILDIENIGKELLAISSNSGDEIINYSGDLQNRLINFLNQQNETWNNSIMTLKEKIISTENKIYELFSTKNFNIETQLFKNLNSLQEEIDKTLKQLKVKESELTRAFFQNIEEVLLRQISDFSELLNLNKSIIIDYNEMLNSALKDLIGSYLENNKKVLNNLKSQFQTNIDDFKNILNEIIKNINDRMIRTIMEHRDSNEANNSELEATLMKGLKHNFEFVQNNTSGLIENVSSEFQNSISTFKENILNLKDDLFQNLADNQTNTQKIANETQNAIFKFLDFQMKTIEKEKNIIDTQLKENVVNEFERLNNEIISARNEGTTYFTSIIKEIEAEPISFKDKLEKLIKNQLESLDREILLLNESTKTTNSNFLVQFKNIILQLQKRFMESSNKYYNGLKDHLSSLEKEIMNSIDSNTLTFKEKTTGFQDELTIILDKGLKYLDNAQEFEKRLLKDSKRYIEMMKKSASIISDNILDLLNKQISDYNLTTGAFKSYYSKSINQEINTAEETLLNLSNNLIKTLQENLKSTKDRNKEFESEITNILDNKFLEVKNSDETLNNNIKNLIKNNLKDSSSLSKTQKIKLKDNINEIDSIFKGLSRKLNTRFTNSFNKHIESNEKIVATLETGLKDSLKQNQEQNQTNIFNLINTISDELKNTILNLKDNVKKLNEKIFQNLVNSQSTIQETANETLNGLRKVLDEQISNIEKENNTFESQLKEKIEVEIHDLGSEIESVKNDMRAYFSNYSKIMEENSSIIKDKISKFIISQINFLERDSLLLNESIKTTISIFASQFENIIERLQLRAFDTFNKHQNGIKERLNTLNKDFLKMINERSNSSKISIQSLQDQFANILEKRLKYLENIRNFQRKITQDLRRHIEMLKKTASVITNDVSNLLNKQLSDFNLTSESFKSYYSKIINKEITTCEETFTQLQNHLNNTFQENLKINKNNYENLQLKIPETFDNSRYIHIKINEKLGKDITELVNTYLLDWRKNIDSIRTKVDFITKNIEDTEKSTRKFLSSIKENFSHQIDKIDVSQNDLQEKIQTVTGKNIKSIYSFLEMLKNGKHKATDILFKNIKDSISFEVSSFSYSFELILEDLKRNFSSNQDAISNSFANYSRILQKQLDIEQEKLSHSITELQSILTTNYLQKGKDKLESWSQSTVSTLKKQVDPIKDMIANEFNQNSENFDIFSLNLKKNILKISENIVKDYELKIQSNLEDIKESLFSQFNDQKDLVTKIINNLNSKLSNNAEKSQQLMKNLNENFEYNTDHQLSNIFNLINTIDSSIVEMLNHFQTKKIEPLSKIVDEIKKDLEYLNAENHTTIEILNSALEEIEKNTFLETENTWSIISSESILDYLTDMGSRTKRSFSIMVPKLSDLDDRFLKNVEPKIIIHIFSHISLDQDEKLIQELLNHQNIRIWHVEDEIKFYWGFKDAEEMLLAPSTKNENEIVGIVTEQPEYLTLFQKIIGPYFHFVSNAVKKLGTGSKATVSIAKSQIL